MECISNNSKSLRGVAQAHALLLMSDFWRRQCRRPLFYQNSCFSQEYFLKQALTIFLFFTYLVKFKKVLFRYIIAKILTKSSTFFLSWYVLTSSQKLWHMVGFSTKTMLSISFCKNKLFLSMILRFSMPIKVLSL